MRTLFFVLPIAILVAYSQIVIKWRMLNGNFGDMQHIEFTMRLLKYVTDPIIVSAYAAALLASFVWLYVITQLPLIVAFPLYIGITFGLVVIGGWFFLSESITTTKIASVLFILVGIIIGVRS